MTCAEQRPKLDSTNILPTTRFYCERFKIYHLRNQW